MIYDIHTKRKHYQSQPKQKLKAFVQEIIENNDEEIEVESFSVSGDDYNGCRELSLKCVSIVESYINDGIVGDGSAVNYDQELRTYGAV